MADLHMKDLVELSNSVRALVKLVSGKDQLQAINRTDVVVALAEMLHQDSANPYKVKLTDNLAGAAHRVMCALAAVENADVALGKVKR